MHRLAIVSCLTFVSIVTVTVSARQAPPPVPATQGVSAGTVTAAGKTVTLAHAYVGSLSDGEYEVVLTDTPLPEAAIATEVSPGGQPLLRQGKASGIAMHVNKKGFVLNLVPFIGENLRGNTMLASAGDLTTFKASATSVTGQGTKAAAQTSHQGWSYSASWNAVPVVVK
ncbi:MAG TPA: hypothetical protein VFX12_12660 [Vicinamibacterales bacterium]|nr:hypothetical protein [Vicinamibacterales bacterium]